MDNRTNFRSGWRKIILNLIMKKIIYIISICLISQFAYSAGSDDNSNDKSDYYNDAKKLVKRAGKLEKKDKTNKAKKLYSEAFKKLEKAYSSDKSNPDILNYMGYTSRKIGNFKQAEKFYLTGLNIKPDHNGINEYLGELYVKTGRMELAKERLDILKSCNCEEYAELKEVIEKN